MYFHRETYAKGCRLEVSDQQRCHVTEAREALVRQESMKKHRKNVRIVRANG